MCESVNVLSCVSLQDRDKTTAYSQHACWGSESRPPKSTPDTGRHPSEGDGGFAPTTNCLPSHPPVSSNRFCSHLCVCVCVRGARRPQACTVASALTAGLEFQASCFHLDKLLSERSSSSSHIPAHAVPTTPALQPAYSPPPCPPQLIPTWSPRTRIPVVEPAQVRSQHALGHVYRTHSPWDVFALHKGDVRTKSICKNNLIMEFMTLFCSRDDSKFEIHASKFKNF